MYRFILYEKKIYVFDRTDKEFKEKYGKNFELIGSVKESDNIDTVASKLVKQYRAEEVIRDCFIKRKFGYKYWSEETKARVRATWSKNRSKRKLSEHHVKRISEGRTGRKGNHTGHPHSEETKNILALRMTGNKAGLGTRWCHNPETKKERMVRGDLPEGFVWGRDPDLEIHKGFPVNS